VKLGFFALAAIVLPALLAGCKRSKETVLVDQKGNMYYGIVSFDSWYKTGTIVFPGTPYGDFTSPFTPVTAAENPVIELSNLRLLQFSGKAHLGNKAMRFLECDITAEFRSKGMGDVKMVG
jgi:hypothetical protein